jgi:D-alanyl-D-alanine carboxypeptidase/D-alanyl-D-alanine-endopeptidase (penicillin-binding protein 4)
VRGTRVVTLVTLALLNVFTLAAGIAVVRMLPPRLNALKVPVADTSTPTEAGTVLASAGASGPLPTSAAIGNALNQSTLSGATVSAMVSDAVTGKVLYDSKAESAAIPASTTKVATAVAALAALGGNARFTTKVVQTGSSLVLVGGGDPDLAVHAYPSNNYPQPATLTELADRTAAALKQQGKRSVNLGYDLSLYSGPSYAPGWTSSDVSSGNVTPIVSLEVDQGRLTPAGAPEDSDDGSNYTPRTTDPAGMAAAAFASLLRHDGISVNLAQSSTTAPSGAAMVASVQSPTVAQLVQQMLTESNNVIAENLGRHVAITMHHDATFSGAAAAVTAELNRLGVSATVNLVDTSGLSPQDGIAPKALVQTIEAAVHRPGLRPAITGMPIAGFNGTLAAHQSVFGSISGAARGVVRAKTGNLTNVATLAGLVVDRNGTLLVFAIMTSGYSAYGLQTAADGVDAAATALARLLLRMVRCWLPPGLRVRWNSDERTDDRLGSGHLHRGAVGEVRSAGEPRRGAADGRGATRPGGRRTGAGAHAYRTA